MPTIDLSALTIAAASEAIRLRRLSPVDVTEAYLARIERLNPAINAYITVTAERARDDARRAEQEIAAENYRGPLHGVPIGLKDLYDTAGIRTTAGSKVHRHHVPKRDSTVARRLREAGSVLLGKLNTHEYAWGVTTNNPHFGPTRNPWDTTRIPGGSSGGSGAAIAASLCCGSMGTDTGGSIRVPAALCGVVGLKPTYGRVSKAGVFPMSYLYDHAGPITRCVEDAAIMLEAVAGYDATDCATVPMPVESYRSALQRDIRGLRLGIPRSRFFVTTDDEVRAAVEAAIDVLRQLGASVVDVALPAPPIEALSVFAAEGKRIHAATLATRPGDLGADLRLYLSAPTIDGGQFADALTAAYAYAEALRVALESVDVLVTPTTPVPATAIGQEEVVIGSLHIPVLFAMSGFTSPFNIARLPALSLPCGFTKNELPIGLQLAGRPFDEATILRTGFAYEQATEWHTRRPLEDATAS